ncbi:15-hydroxyprostaglandin dehydrogenase [NAD(+)]-like [Bombyx mandarina]|uniref:Alcohol dehydrogenase n=2 Tax=Bombyx TaxID=7090 RepID=A0A8R2QVK0_BOMMO|nr:15-hydroxyprostaglandin dehydrogenase [NAD(+)]-like [Bombyx mandarina]XP_037867172.1 15-hydroxyprostaglandin dehydrogenase [NAD(+)]-like [Bombyx mori]
MIHSVIKTFFVFCFVINIASALSDLKNENEIEGKVVVVTGAAQGIGYAIADNFLKNGAKVIIILDINVPKGIQAAKELNCKYGKNKAEFIECDITKDLERVSKMIYKKYKYVDVLVNNAGIGEENKPRKLLLTNAVATIEFSLKFMENMRKDKLGGKGGTIINIASIVVHYIDPFFFTYRGTKFAIMGFSRSLGHEYNYKKNGVRVLTICPGATNTTLISNNFNLDSEDAAALAKEFQYQIIQSPDNVGKGAVEIFKNAKTGSSWDIENEKPPVESTDTIRVLKIGESH